MKFFLGILSLLSMSAAVAWAQAPPTERPVVGGYAKIGVLDKDVVEAATFAVKDQAKKEGAQIELVKIVQAKRQVVAGMNYQLLLEVKSQGVTSKVHAILWKKLDGSHDLTEWQPLKGKPKEGKK